MALAGRIRSGLPLLSKALRYDPLSAHRSAVTLTNSEVIIQNHKRWCFVCCFLCVWSALLWLNRIRLTWLRLCLVAEKWEENLEVIREMKGLIVSCFWGYLNSEMKGCRFTKHMLIFFFYELFFSCFLGFVWCICFHCKFGIRLVTVFFWVFVVRFGLPSVWLPIKWRGEK